MAERRVIQFEDLDGEMITEEWYFRLDQKDALDLDVAHMKDPVTYMKGLLEQQNSRGLLDLWRSLLFASVGKRVGSRLVKSPELLAEFRDGGAFAALFDELLKEDDLGAGFMNKIMPKHIQEKAEAEARQLTSAEFTDQQLLEMSDEDFFKAAGTSNAMKMDKRFLNLAMARRNNAA